MRLVFRDGVTRVELLVGVRSIRKAQPAIDGLRDACGQAAEVTTSLGRALGWSGIHRHITAAMLLRDGGTPWAVVWLTFRCWRGVALGYAGSGDLSGQGSVVALPDARRRAMEVAARILLRRPLAHTAVLSIVWPGGAPPAGPATVAGVGGEWQFHDVRFRLPLEGGYGAVMDRLSYKMRRNLRYYRRRAEKDLGCRFVPDLSAAQRREAVQALFPKGRYAVDRHRAETTDAALQNLPNGFAMGLQGADGAWLSFITGWRQPDGTFVDWALNDDSFSAASLSTVMRSFLLEHEAERGSPALVFVGLTSDFWSRCCEADIRADLVATRPGAIGMAARWATNRFRSTGRVALLQSRAEDALGG